MNMIEVNTAELSGAALDWATFCAVFSGMQPTIRKIENVTIERQPFIKPLTFPSALYLTYSGAYEVECNWNPSSAWEDGGPLIEQHGIKLEKVGSAWFAGWMYSTGGMVSKYEMLDGETDDGNSYPLIAACRAIVAAKLGDTVQIPAELLP